jgi:hypothetical protein
MDEFRGNVIVERQRDQIQQIQIHGVIGKRDMRDLIYPAVEQVQFQNS